MRNLSLAKWLQKRYLISMLICLGIAIIILLQLSMSIAIVQMTRPQEVTVGNKTFTTEPEFKWSAQMKALIPSVSYYGVLLSPLGGMLAKKYGGATIFGTSVAATGIVILMTPFLARQNMIIFISTRILKGIFHGFAMSSSMEVLVHWTPTEERCRLIGNGFNGLYLGAIMSYPISGFVAQQYGWEAVFYVTGGIAELWFLIWLVLVTNKPEDDKLITKAEKKFLKEKVPPIIDEKITYPWKSILTSAPVWAFINEYFSLSWSIAFLVNNLPLYINDIQKGSINTVGLIACIPSIGSFTGSIIAAFACDFFRVRKIIHIHKVYKIFISFGQILTMTMLIVTGLWMGFEGSMICFTIIRFFFSFAETSYEVIPVDLAPTYASVIRGLAVSALSIGEILSPTMMGFIVSDGSRVSWNRYFLFLSFFNLWSLIIFIIFGSADLQPWGGPRSDTNKKEINQKNETGIITYNEDITNFRSIS